MESTLILRIPFVLLSRHAIQETKSWGPLQAVYETLQLVCKDVPIGLWAPGDDGLRSCTSWMLQSTSSEHKTGDVTIHEESAGVAQDTDGQLTETERVYLNGKSWSYSMALQRFNIPLCSDAKSWHSYEEETRKIIGALKQAFYDFIGPLDGYDGDVKWWSLVCGQNCQLSVTVIPCSGTYGSVTVQKLLTTATAFERELTLLSTPTSLVHFWSMSRFLEYRVIRNLAAERAVLWRNLKEKKHITEKRRAALYQRDKEKWLGGLGDENESYEKTNGARREWWHFINRLDEAGAVELISQMKRFGEAGRRLGFECGFNGRLREEQESSNDMSKCVSSMAFRGYRSTLDAETIIAYTELFAGLVRLSAELSHEALRDRLERFRDSVAVALHDQPCGRFEGMLDTLCIGSQTRKFWRSHLRSIYTEPDVGNSAHAVSFDVDYVDSRYDPFHRLRRYISATLSKEKAYMPTFVDRYERAGGFYATSGKKLYALMVKEEHESKRSGDKKQMTEWLGGLGNVRGDDAIVEKTRKVRLTDEERREKEEWIREWNERQDS